MTKLMEIATQRVIRYLSKEGQRLIELASATKDTNIQTGNQEESYGWAVWHNGKRVCTNYLHPFPIADTPARYKGREIWGGTELKRAFKMLDSMISPKGFALAILNAVPYTRVLENGLWVTEKSKHQRRKFRIISQVFTDLHAVGTPFKGANVREIV